VTVDVGAEVFEATAIVTTGEERDALGKDRSRPRDPSAPPVAWPEGLGTVAVLAVLVFLLIPSAASVTE
jgi:hypothetical protein